MSTPDNQIELVKEVCGIINKSGIVEHCTINDFGSYGNFDIFIWTKKMEKSNTIKLKKIVKQAIEQLKSTSDDEDALKLKIRSYFAPAAIRTWCNYDKVSRIIGYDRDYWAFDIDINNYDKDSNSFF